MTKMRDKTVLPQLTMPEKNGEVLYPFGPPVFRFEINHDIIDMMVEEGKKNWNANIKDHRKRLAGHMREGTSVRLDGEVKDNADREIIQKVFEFFDVLTHNYGPGWPNIAKTLTNANNELLSLRLQQLWINFQHKNDFNPLHDHSGVFSFVIFGDIDKKIFTENVPPTNSNMAGRFVATYGERITPLQSNAFTLEPYKGLGLIFPAALQHYVPPFYTDFERVSISGNYVLEQAPPNQPMNMK
jgi:hypothetical protein